MAKEKKSKKGFPVGKVIILIIVLIIAGFGLIAYTDIQQRLAIREAKFEITSTNVDVNSKTLTFVIRLTNPTSGVAVLDDSEISVFYEGNKLASKSISKTTLDPNASRTFSFDILIESFSQQQLLTLAQSGGAGTYRIDGISHTKILGMTLDFPFSFTITK